MIASAMESFVFLVVLAACSIALTHGYCYELPVMPGFDEQTMMFYYTNCTLKDGTTRAPGEQWIDSIKCEQCECGIGCCGFGFALVARKTDVYKDGEQCVPVRTGDCNQFKFVRRSKPGVECQVTAGMA